MQATPKSLRLQIGLFGRVNSGKSSFLNLITGQHSAITSEIAGTTTDIVEKAQELIPLGPVLWLDTAGYGDNTQLSSQRLSKTEKVMERADICILVCEGDKIGDIEKKIISSAKKHNIPLIKIYNKSDKYPISKTDGITVCSTNTESRDKVLAELKKEILKACPENYINNPPIVSDLVPENSTVIMIIPLDYEAPKGRLIMPQVQTIRDCLDNKQNVIMVREDNYPQILNNLRTAPSLVICDSQIVDKMVAQTPPTIKCTTFSILMARFKGDLAKLTEGVTAIHHLEDEDKILIAEACTHHALKDDIGRVKIPNLLRQKTNKKLIIDYTNGCDYALDISQYKLVIHCGGCAINRREFLSRINKCVESQVAITNYGICISELKGVLEQVLRPFAGIYQNYKRAKEECSPK